jgi:hypothetical protein
VTVKTGGSKQPITCAKTKSQRWDSNPQHPHYECGALPIEATLANPLPEQAGTIKGSAIFLQFFGKRYPRHPANPWGGKQHRVTNTELGSITRKPFVGKGQRLWK